MNIDKEKLAKSIYDLSTFPVNMTKSAIFNCVKDCEIEQADCEECKWSDEEPIDRCLSCIHDERVDNFKRKASELDKIFIGAPVMRNVNKDECECCYIANEWSETSKSNRELGVKYTLPSVEEAPKNTWLAPWLRYQKGLDNYKLLLWMSDNNIRIINKDADLNSVVLWQNVIKLQILDIR